MSKGLDLIKRQQPEIIDGFPTGNIFIGVAKEELTELENELKDYQEIKEIAKRYNWDAIISEIFNVEMDKKYRHLFSSAIVDIQKDYRKARALEIIKEKKVNVPSLITLFKSNTSYEDYEQLWDNDIRWQLTKNWDIQFSRKKIIQEEYDLLKEVLL